MNTMQTTPNPMEAQQVLASAVAHQIERMSKDEVQALVAKALGDLQNENAALKERIANLEEADAARAKLMARLEAEAIWENFDPSESTIPFEKTLAEAEKLLDGYPGDA